MDPVTGSRLYDLLKDDIESDITFIVQGKEVKAHRVVALSQGGLLKDLLLPKRENVIRLSDEISPDNFETILQYIYTDKCDISDQNLFGVNHVAKILRLEALERYCANFVKGKLGAANVVTYAAHASELDAKENIKVCQDYFRKNTTEVLKSKDFSDVSLDVLKMFCDSEGLSCSELELFTAYVQWAKSECLRQRRQATPENLRAVLGDVLKKIRFPAMKKEEFEDNVILSKILTFDQIGRIMFGWKKGENISPFPGESRTEVVEVTVTDHRGSQSEHCLPLSTQIGDLKKRDILHSYDGIRILQQFPADQFTLAHNGVELRNDETLQSVYTPGKKLVIDLHSVQVQVKHHGGQWEFPLTIMKKDFPNWQKVVKGYTYALKGKIPDKLSTNTGRLILLPGLILTAYSIQHK